jgi:hypothetical protein
VACWLKLRFASNSVGVVLANKRCPVERIGGFENLESKVRIDAMCCHPRLHFSPRLHAVQQRILTTNERSKPCAQEEDLAMLFDVLKFV